MLGEHFRLGEECVVFEEGDDLRKKAEYYVTHEDERREMARRGHERTKRYHTCFYPDERNAGEDPQFVSF